MLRSFVTLVRETGRRLKGKISAVVWREAVEVAAEVWLGVVVPVRAVGAIGAEVGRRVE